MQKTRLFELISSLSKKEFFDFETYLIHFTDARQKCKTLYSCFKESYIDKGNSWLKGCPQKEEILGKIFNKKIKNQQASLAVLCNELCDYLISYFAFLMHKQKNKDLLVQQYFFERNMFDNYKKYQKKVDEKMGEIVGWQSTHLRTQLVEIDIEFGNYHYNIKPNLSFEDLYYAFKEYYFVKQLKNYCILLSSALIISQEIDSSIQKEMNTLLNSNNLTNFKDHLLINLYKTCSQMLLKKSGSYKLLKNLLESQKLSIEKEDHKTIRNAMLTYCNNMMYQPNEKSTFYREEHLLNYFYMYENDLLNAGNYLPVMHLKNICSLAVVRTKEIGRLYLSEDKVQKLINESYGKVTPKHQKSTYCFNLGVWHFYKKQYYKAIEILSTSNTYANAFFTYDSRTILLRCHYILDNFEIVEKQAVAAKEALRREKQLSIRHKTEYRNFFIFIEKLSRIKTRQKYIYRPSIQQKLVQLKRTITEKPTKLRNWFFGEIETMQNK